MDSPRSPCAFAAFLSQRRPHHGAESYDRLDRGGVCAGERMCVAVAAAVFRGLEVHRVPLVRDLDAGGVWDRLHRAVLDALMEHGVLDVSRVMLDSAHVRAKKGEVKPVQAPWTGVSPVPRCMCYPIGAHGLSWSLSHVATSMTVGHSHR
jgi:hypothetical protein